MAAADADAFVLEEELLALVALETRTGALEAESPLGNGECFDVVARVAVWVLFEFGAAEC